MSAATADLPVIVTPRTVMRVPSPDDAQLLLDYKNANRAHLAPWEPARDAAYFTLAATRERIAMLREDCLAGRGVPFIAVAPDSGAIVATCNLSNIVRGVFQACHLGYSVAAARQGSGIMTEVAQAAIDHAFGTLGLHRVMANYMPANERSARLLEKLGFEREGYARAYLRIDGRWEDHVLTARINPRAD